MISGRRKWLPTIYSANLALFMLFCGSTENEGSYWTTWVPWSACSRTCLTGIQFRSRVCVGECAGLNRRTRTCYLGSCFNGRWTDWTPWTWCSAPCNGGIRIRTRSCLYGQCLGNPVQKLACNLISCRVPIYGQWTSWTACSQTCGSGNQIRTRPCIRGLCVPVLLKERRACDLGLCWNSWNNWLPWTACTTTCGPGTQLRTRTCIGAWCSGSVRETVGCAVRPCPVSSVGYWTGWAPWTSCTKECGGGRRLRVRHCVPRTAPCIGPRQVNQMCNVKPCSSAPLNSGFLASLGNLIIKGIPKEKNPSQ